jgi:hypothetical protein
MDVEAVGFENLLRKPRTYELFLQWQSNID